MGFDLVANHSDLLLLETGESGVEFIFLGNARFDHVKPFIGHPLIKLQTSALGVRSAKVEDVRRRGCYSYGFLGGISPA